MLGDIIQEKADKSKCQSYCFSAYYSCKDGNLNRMKLDICNAKCIGYKTGNGGIFSSSDYDKCLNRCLENY